jgi:hypothetical protein
MSLRVVLFLCIALAATATAARAQVTGAVSVSVVDRSGAMVTDLRPEELTLKEDGQTRVIKRVERDTRPLALGVLVDSSEVMGKGFLRELADPVMDFIDALPAGVDRTLMMIGTPPEVIPLEDPAATRAALRARAPFGKLSLYDGIADASRRLGQKRGSRRVLVVLFSDRATEDDRQTALEEIGRARPLVLAVQFQGAGTYAPGLDTIVKWTGGRYEQIGGVSGVGGTLKKLRPELDAPWLVVYETPGAVDRRDVEVKVTRKDAKARVRAAGLE